MLIAVPALAPGEWIAYSLSVIEEVGRLELAGRTLDLALGLLRPRGVTVVTQWASGALGTHLPHAPLEVLAAWLPMHDDPASAALRYEPDGEGGPSSGEAIDVHDPEALRALQRTIEAGARALVVEDPDHAGVPRVRFEPGAAPAPTVPPPVDEPPLRSPRADLSRLRPFVVATPSHQAALDPCPLGRPIAPAHRIDPLRTRSATFLERLERLDRLAFGPEGMPMPRWLFFDGAELPGVIVGLGIDARALSEDQRAFLELEDEPRGLVPLAMYIAIPMLEPGAWFGHNLASVGRQLPGAPLRGLGSLTKAVALAAMRARTQLGATQWDSEALHVHCRMGELDLLTAWTPAHSEPWTLTYRAHITDRALENLAHGRAAQAPPSARWVEGDDYGAMRTLQEEIEGGARYAVVGRPGPRGVPIARRDGS